MKNKLKIKTLLFTLTVMLFVNVSFASFNTRDSSVCLKINGLILKAPKKAERGRYKIELLNDNKAIDSIMVPVNRPFEFKLSKNTWYTLRITKDGFVPLLISVDTKMKDDNAFIYEFQFETELLDAGNVNTANKSIMDFPIGVVRFDAANNRFYPLEDYTADIKKKIFDPEKSQKYGSDFQTEDKSMMANQDDPDMIVK